MSRPKDSHHLTTQDIGLALREELMSRLAVLDVFEHPISKGAAAEQLWIDVLNGFLPPRCRASSAFILDHRGCRSAQIDIAVYDAHFAPSYLQTGSLLHLPAEAVHAVFEVKQLLNTHLLADAAAKAASVRCLSRTSNTFPQAALNPFIRKPFPILAGVLASDSAWPASFPDKVREHLRPLDPDHRLDLGCVLRHGAFETLPDGPGAHVTGPDESLQFLLARLFARLQAQGNPPAVDIMQANPNLLPLNYPE
jgi:hypothetical protein